MATAVSSLLALVPDPAQRKDISIIDPGLGLVLHVCASAPEADRLLAHVHPDVVMAGRGSPPGWLQQVRNLDPDIFRILGTESDALAPAIEAINRGDADAVLAAPLDPDAILRLIHHGCETALLRRHSRSLVNELAVRNNELMSFNERLEELVTERTHHLVDAQERLQEQQRQVVQLETQSTVSHLLRGLAHEFNNPLAAIFGYAQRLRRTAQDPDVIRRVDVILQEVDHCRTVVQQLRQLATPLAEVPVRTHPETALTIAVERLRAAGSPLPQIANEGPVPEVIAAPRALARVFEQILLNAIEAGATMVSLSGDVQADRVRLQLTNDGETPDETVIANAIRPFFTTRAGQDHRGLGLPTAAALLHEQDGTIELALNEDGLPGAAAVILLPAADPLQRKSVTAFHRALPTQSAATGPRILVVDDEAMILDLIVDVVRDQGRTSSVATSIAEAVTLLSSQDIQALIIDLNLPDGSGLDLARRAQAWHPALAGHIALTTGESDRESLERLVAEHGFPVLAKPFRLDAVAAMVLQIS